MREKATLFLGRSFAGLGMAVLISGSIVFGLFVLGMVTGGDTGARLAATADRIMSISLWLALLTTVTGMLQMYAGRESALQISMDENPPGEPRKQEFEEAK